MNHPSEWSKFFGENAGRYRYKHKGSGVIRDTQNVVKTAVEKAAKTVAERAGQKVGEIAVEKGSKQIR